MAHPIKVKVHEAIQVKLCWPDVMHTLLGHGTALGGLVGRELYQPLFPPPVSCLIAILGLVEY